MQVGVGKAWYTNVNGRKQSEYQHSAKESGTKHETYGARVYPPFFSYAILSMITRCCKRRNTSERGCLKERIIPTPLSRTGRQNEGRVMSQMMLTCSIVNSRQFGL